MVVGVRCLRGWRFALGKGLVFAAYKQLLFVWFFFTRVTVGVNGRLTDEETGEEIACYDVEFTVQQNVEDGDWWIWW